jgi:ribosome-binding protein aMBF1 (putative translation factor)
VRNHRTLGHMEPLTWHVGDVVKKLREKKGWSQTELAKEARVHKNTVARIEDGSEGAKSNTLKKIAVADETIGLYRAVSVRAGFMPNCHCPLY